MRIKDITLTNEDFIRFISWIPKIAPFSYEKNSRAPMSAESFQLLYKLMYYCALKGVEVFKLKKKDFDLNTNLLTISAKGNKPTQTTIPPIILGDVKDFLKDKNDNDFIFVSKYKKKPLNRMTVWQYAKDAGKIAGLNIFQITEKREIEGMSFGLFRDSYEQFMSAKDAPKGLIDLKFRRTSDNRYGNHTLHDLKKFERSIFKTTLSEDEIQDYLSWYVTNREIFADLAEEIYAILAGVLKQRNISVADIRPRAKEPEKFQQKLMNGVTYDPKDMQDLAGIQVICFVKSDVGKIANVIEKTFEVIDKESNDDKEKNSGYSDVKFICKLTKARINPAEELQRFENKRFEIQVRTILQHAWAEIEHDDIYKNPHNISQELRRRFFLVSKVLEMADNELDNLHHKINDEIKE